MSRRYTHPLALNRPTPAPNYPEYASVREEALQTHPRIIGMEHLIAFEDVAGRRGRDWCSGVLGFSFPGIERITTGDAQMLIVADQLGLEPPLPETIVQERAAAQEHQRLLKEQRDRQKARDVRKWQESLAASTVPVQVRANTRGGGRAPYLGGGPLHHVVPTEDAVSGARRLHPTGRALCETSKARELELGEPTDHEGTCVRCLGWMPKVRRVADGRTWWVTAADGTDPAFFAAPTSKNALSQYRALLIDQDRSGDHTAAQARARVAALNPRIVLGPLSTPDVVDLDLGQAWAERAEQIWGRSPVTDTETQVVPLISHGIAVQLLGEEETRRIETDVTARYTIKEHADE